MSAQGSPGTGNAADTSGPKGDKKKHRSGGSADNGGQHHGGGGNQSGNYNAHSWAVELLHRLNVKPTSGAVQAIVAWEAAEGGNWNNTAHFNPLNTTQDAPGATSMNGVGVKAYTSWEQGFDATIQTLHNGNYDQILAALRSGNAHAIAESVVNSPWGTKSINVGGDYATYGHGAGMAGGGSADAFDATGGTGGSQDVSRGDIRHGLADLGFVSGLIHSNKSLLQAFHKIINKQIDVSTSSGRARALNILQNTAWYQNHSKSQRQFDELKFSDPATWQRQIDQQRHALAAQARSMGLALDDGQLDHLAHLTLRNGLSNEEINHVLAKHFDYEPGQGYGGEAGSALDTIEQLAKSYYVPISGHQLQHYTRQVLQGSLDPNSLNDVFKQQALSLFPYLKQQLNAGQTVADIADPYRQLMANTLELNPDSIKLHDKSIMQALQSKGEDGEMGLMPLWQFQQKLMDDPRWLQTANAHNTLVGTVGNVLQKMGLIT